MDGHDNRSVAKATLRTTTLPHTLYYMHLNGYYTEGIDSFVFFTICQVWIILQNWFFKKINMKQSNGTESGKCEPHVMSDYFLVIQLRTLWKWMVHYRKENDIASNCVYKKASSYWLWLDFNIWELNDYLKKIEIDASL